MSDERDDNGEDRRTPIPVREMVPDRKPEPVRRREAEPTEIPEITLAFEVEGEEWIAKEAGRTRSGTSPDSGAPLLLVTFHRAGAEEESGGDQESVRAEDPEREALTVARSLEDLSPLQVEELFQRSRPFRPPERKSEEGGRDHRRHR